MSHFKQIRAGYSVSSSPTSGIEGTLSYHQAMVIMHKLGSDEHGFMTPQEARELAWMLIRAAQNADPTKMTGLPTAEGCSPESPCGQRWCGSCQ